MSNISITRNISQTVEMVMATEEGYTLRAEVLTQNGNVASINNGAITVTDNSEYRGSFNAFGEGSVSVSIQGVKDPADRISLYSAAEDFTKAAKEYYATSTEE